jgi:hypothetical protein
MKKVFLLFFPCFLAISFSCSDSVKVDLEQGRTLVKEVLDNFIKAHEQKDLQLLLSCFSDESNILILGTDRNELWVDKTSLGETQKRAYEVFDKVQLSVRDKVINISPCGKTAWFYMRVDWYVEAESQNYKLNDIRTTGVIINEGKDWNIVQLHTSQPVHGQAVKY